MAGIPAPRATRSDGERSRRQILHAAARLASTRGLQHLSIGDLAEEAGFSKSGLYAHFRSKEALQLATIATASEIYEAEVYGPARRTPPGLNGLLALVDAHLDHLRRRVFPGGCFFEAAASDLAGRPGPVHDEIAAFQAGWSALVGEHLRVARERGELGADEDLEQVAFDVTAAVLLAHSLLTFAGDEAALERAGRSVRRRLGRA
jgi:AcrR family transcriptional regulator